MTHPDLFQSAVAKARAALTRSKLVCDTREVNRRQEALKKAVLDALRAGA